MPRIADRSSFSQRYGPWALVAGASEGLGAAFARALAGRGLSLVLVARRGELLDALASELRARYSASVRTLALDLGQPGLLEGIRQATGDLEIGLLVYNAALSPIGLFLEQPEAQTLQVLDVNCRGPALLAHELGRAMRDRGRGGILLMSSMAGLQGSALLAHYAATRAYNLALAEGLWAELRPHGVDVLACCAGATRTPGFVASAPARTGFFSAPVMEPEAVVESALGALGRRPSLVPGLFNRLASVIMQRLLPRQAAVSIMSRTTRAMYAAGRRSEEIAGGRLGPAGCKAIEMRRAPALGTDRVVEDARPLDEP